MAEEYFNLNLSKEFRHLNDMKENAKIDESSRFLNYSIDLEESYLQNRPLRH